MSNILTNNILAKKFKNSSLKAMLVVVFVIPVVATFALALGIMPDIFESHVMSVVVEGGIMAALTGYIAFLIHQSISQPLSGIGGSLENLSQGRRMDFKVPDDASGDFSQVIAAAEVLAETSIEAQRIRSATDVTNTNVMIANEKYEIVYMNKTMMEMLRGNEAALRKELPRLDVNNLMGTCIDVFHKSPAHQRGILDNLTTQYDAALDLADLNFELTVNPILDNGGRRIGTVVEWEDVTEKMATEENLAQIARESLRIKSATDAAKTNIMVADDNYNIVYVNDTMVEMLKGNEAALKQELSRLDVNNIIGTNIDVFHKNPAHQRSLLDNLASTLEASLDVAGINFELTVNPIRDNEGHRIGTVVEWEDVTEKLITERKASKLANDNMRIKIALDNTSTNVMVADKDLNIVYLNDSLDKMLRESERDLRKVLPNFDSNKLIGTNIDVFHANPAHQRQMLNGLNTSINSNIKVGAYDFNLVVNPVRDENGVRLGSVVEWKDMTQELAIEAELEEVVKAAVAGDFTKRVVLKGKEGFMLNLANNINDIGSNTQDATDDLARVLAELAKGNLTERIDADYDGTFEVLKNSSNETAGQLTNIVSKVNHSAGEVATASAELSEGSDDLSRRTEAQASSLEETAASMEELAVTVRQNADSAKEANDLAAQSRDMASNGGDVAEKAVSAMGAIEDSSQKISDIIGVIDDLAFQTNLLALNAAVEAARAGEAGKGFAVVAEEVRTLAQRSASASNEIKDLITNSNSQVKSGVELVNKAGSALGDIVASISQVADIVSEISSASVEQTQGIDEVNTAITQMDDMTQQNASLVEESTAAARLLEQQAAEMQRLMAFFNVGEGSQQLHGVTSSTPSPARAQQQHLERSVIETPVSSAPRKAAAAGGNSNDSDWAEF